MEEKAKLVFIVIVTLIVSLTTSYLTTIALQTANSAQQQSTQQTSIQNITRIVELEVKTTHFNPTGDNYVEVIVEIKVENITLDFEYTCLNGTVSTASLEYGSYTPNLERHVIISPNEDAVLNFKIPDYIITATSTTKSGDGFYGYDIFPQVEVKKAYGYT